MRKITATICTILLLCLAGSFFLAPESTHAQATTLIEGVAQSTVNNIFAYLGNGLLYLTSWAVTISGIFLSISINVTTHLGLFFDKIPALREIWIITRNLASMFIIFLLMYASIMTIVGAGTGKVKELVGKIIMAGLLLNFSLFFARVAIDASNIVSLQFYRAIAPEFSSQGLPSDWKMLYTDGGLSNVFMSALKIPAIYQNKDFLRAGEVSLAIAFYTFAGMIMMITAAISFFAAAIAFIARTGILLFIMALSPFYFAGMVFPQVEKRVSSEMMKWFTSQLLFMPIYLFLMYVALTLLNSAEFKSIFNQNATTAVAGGLDPIGLTFVGVVIQFVIAFIFINAPLAVAISFGAVGAKWAPDGKFLSGWVAKNTIGRKAADWDKKLENTHIGNSKVGRWARSITTEKAAGAKWATNSSFKDDKKKQKEIDKKGREIEMGKQLKLQLASAAATGNAAELKKTLKNMSTAEIAALDKDHLTNPVIIPHLSSAVYTAIDKSDKSDKDKVAISNARIKALSDAVTGKDSDKVKAIMKNMTGEDLQEYLEEEHLEKGKPVSDDLIMHIHSGQLKKMDSMDEKLKKEIGNSIYLWTGKFQNNHAAYKYIDDNRGAWTS